MRAPGRPEAKAELEVKLRQWMRMAQLFAARREGRFKVHPEHYKELHRHLLRVVGQAAENSDRQKRAVYGELKEALRPWVNVESLTKADRDILFGVLAECEAVRRSLRRRLMVSVPWVKPGLILIGAGFGIGVLLVLWEPSVGRDAVLDLGLSLRNWARWAFATFIGASVHRQLLIGGGVAMVIAMLVVWYSARKY
jgi:hypothetical protein